MDATPEVYRYDIQRSKEAIANLERSPLTETDAALRRALVRQLDELEQGLARAEQEWAQAQARGVGRRLDP